MQEVTRGARLPLDAVYRNDAGDLVDPTTPLVDILDANAVVVDDAVPVRESLGHFNYPAGGYLVPDDATLGVWTARWTGTVDGDLLTALDEFEVVAALSTPDGTLDVITLAEAKSAVNIAIANTDHDAKMAGYVSAVSLAMDQVFGPIVQRQVIEYHDGGRSVFLRDYPVASVVSVVERNGTTATALTVEDFSAPTGADYQIDTATGILSRRSGGSAGWFAGGSQNVVVTFVAGRFTATSTVDARFKQGAAIMLAHLWRPEQGLTAGPFAPEGGQMPLTFAVPTAVVQLLANEKRGPVCA